MKKEYWLIGFGLLLVLIFGGGFLIRLMRDGDFYVAEFIGGVVGLVVVLTGTLWENRNQRSMAKIGK